MPTYELILLLKKLDPTGLKSVLTRNAKYVLESGGTLRKMENFGLQQTPFRIMKTGLGKFDWAHYFLFCYDAGFDQNAEIMGKFKRDLDVIKSKSFVETMVPGVPRGKNNKKFECTLHEDVLPAPYRPSVKKMLMVAEQKRKSNDKHKLKYYPGLDYDPL